MNVLSKVNPDKTSIKEKKQALPIITLFKEKIFVKIKGRACAGEYPSVDISKIKMPPCLQCPWRH